VTFADLMTDPQHRDAAETNAGDASPIGEQMSSIVRAAQIVLALGLAISTPCQAAPEPDWSRNPQGFELGVQQEDGGPPDGWRGWFTLRACKQPSCFQTRAELAVKADAKGIWETTLPIAAGACNLKIVNLPYRDMDSNDWRITALPASSGGCASAPAGVSGVYKSVHP
jgi:hypothetical protein